MERCHGYGGSKGGWRRVGRILGGGARNVCNKVGVDRRELGGGLADQTAWLRTRTIRPMNSTMDDHRRVLV